MRYWAKGGSVTESIKTACDAGALFLTVGAIADVLPKVAAAMAIIWYCTRFWLYIQERKAEAAKRKRRARRGK